MDEDPKCSLTSLLLSKMPKYSWCSDYKQTDHKKLQKQVAIEKRYITMNGDGKLHWLSIDVDHTKDMGLWIDESLPQPTLLVQTDKGHHIHYLLCDPVYGNGREAPKNYMRFIQEAIIYRVRGDPAAKGLTRMWRNPLRHYTIYTDVSYHLHDFDELLSDYYSIKSSKNQFAIYLKQAKEDNGSKGSMRNGDGRNSYLFDEVRQIAYGLKRLKSDLTFDDIFDISIEKNLEFGEPLSPKEVESIANSIYRFISTRYKYNSETSSREWQRKYHREYYRKHSNSNVQSLEPLSRQETLEIARSARADKQKKHIDRKIQSAIRKLTETGKKVSNASIAETSGLSRTTVVKYRQVA